MKFQKLFVSAALLCSAGASAADAARTKALYELTQKKGSYYTFTFPTLLAASAKINYAVNKEIAHSLHLNEAPCEVANGSSWEVGTSSIVLLPGIAFSLNAGSAGYCNGAAHPSAESFGLVFDLSTGNLATLPKQLAGGKTQVLDELLLQHGLSDLDASGDCKETLKELGATAASFYIVNQMTIHIMTDLPHYAAACNVDMDVTLDSISSSLASGSLLEKLLLLNNE